MDAQGRTVGAGGAGDAIRAIQAQPASAPNNDCCNEVLKRLDKLDDIAKMLKDLADQNAALRQELAGLKQNQQDLENRLNNVPPPPQPLKPPSADEVAQAVTAEIEKKKQPNFELLGVNVGADSNGHVTFTGRGHY